MNFKKVLAVILCAAMIACILCSCGKTADDSQPAPKAKDDSVVMIINGREISKGDFKYFLNYYKNNLEQYIGTITAEDWSSEISEGYTYRDYVLNGAYEWFTYAAAIRMQAERLDSQLDDEDMKVIDDQWQQACDSYGGEAAFLTALSQNGCTKELYRYIVESAYLSDKCFTAMYGDSGSAVTDKECEEYVKDDGYLMAKHILILTTKTGEDGQDVEMTDEEKAEAKAKVEGFIAELDNTLKEEVEAKFDELMNQYTEDPGIANYPGGYLFQEGDMVTEFYEAARDLEIGRYSGVVETSYGYHLILRVPIDYDVIPASESSTGYTLRSLVADKMFGSVVDSCAEKLEITKDIDKETFDIEAFLAVG